MEHQNPLVAGVVTGTQATYPEKVYSFLNISDPNVLLWSLKPTEDGAAQGLIVRVWNFANNSTNLKISFDREIASAYQATHVETNLCNASIVNGDLQESIGHHQIKTFRIMLKNAE